MKHLKLLFLCLLTSFWSCNDDEIITDNPSTEFKYDKGSSVNRSFIGLVLDTSGNPVVGATVTIGTTTVQTSSTGSFSIENASVNEKFAHVKVTKSGYVDGSRVLVPTTGSNRVNIMLIPSTTTGTVNSGVVGEVSLPNGTKVKFDGSFKDTNGNAYSGIVNVGLYQIKPSDIYFSEAMPGSLLASDANNEARVLESYGMLHVELRGTGGQKLNIATGHTAEITMDIDVNQASTPATIPLWSFDETNGIWKQEGTATKVGNKYVGTVSHFSWWNCDASFSQCNLMVTVNNNSGQPISGLQVLLFRPSQSYGVSGTTNSNGQVTGIIPANETLTLQVKDSCGNIIYTSSIGPYSTGSSNNLTPINLAPTAINTVSIQGTLQNCSNANVTNGLVKLLNPNSLNYFYSIATQPITNGSFTFTMNICGTSQVFELIGEDYTALQTTGTINFTATAPITNIGVVNACNSVNEFITYKVDNGVTRYILSGINAFINGPVSNTLFVNVQNNPTFFLGTTSIVSPGVYNSGFNMEVSSNTPGTSVIGFTSPPTTSMQLNISQIGAIGGYIDFTANGTFIDSSSISHTLTVTGHVIRDN